MNLIKSKIFKKIFNKFNKFSASVNLKPTELNLQDKKCLCLVPHPDDESIGMGGVLALFGQNFDVILLTDGRKGIKDKAPEEVTAIRQEEFKNAMQIANVQNHSFLNVEDKKLLSGFESFKAIDISTYDYIFVPNIIDQHPDHKAVSLLLCELFKSGTNYKKDLKIVMYEVWSTLGITNAYVDISDVVETKKAMINCYKSQTEQKDYVYHALGLNQYRGMFKDKKFVEAFVELGISEFQNLCEIY